MFDPESYTIATSILFPRLLGFIYFFAFGALLFQIKGLIGENGILPIGTFLKRVKANAPKRCYVLVPSVFWINHADTALMAVTLAGTALSMFLMAGVYPLLMLFLLYILFLSIVSTGQDFFFSGGVDGFLLNVTFTAFFLLMVTPANLLVWIGINLTLFRFHLQAGVLKLQSNDPKWYDLTAISCHYLSQEIPNTLAWHMDKLPMWFHRLSTILMFFIEIILPVGIFGPAFLRLWVFYIFVGFQLLLWMTGNFSYLNLWTIVLCTILLSNTYLEGFISPPITEATPLLIFDALCWGVGAALIGIQLALLWNTFFPLPAIKRWLHKIATFRICNDYGVYASIRKGRQEVVVEGSDDEVHWKEYLFFYKPSEISRRPRTISPYTPRLDKLASRLSMKDPRSDKWFPNFLIHLLKGTSEVLALLRENPFKEKPPKFIRSSLYSYTYTSIKEKRETGNWWNRKFLHLFTNTIVLRKSIDNRPSSQIGNDPESKNN